MKRQKIFIAVRQAMAESTYGSTERDDEIDYIQTQFGLSSNQLRAVCIGGPKTDYWNR